ncbi:hypothetical protein PVAND_006025 [Polypedilum vanderplanki]|uniref:Uncharacterized protein n=1 Tax=Polypedilum vanderplanki TaxID=319348 RepID=A0A9J6C2R9_POLVA|nr:hypothetical protein PVAND_006025 [Polypedilum vanderplanki]
MLFEFMTSDMRKPLPETIEDLVKMSYSIVISCSNSKELCPSYENNNELINSRKRPNLKIITQTEFKDLYNSALKGEYSKKLAFFVDDITHAALNSTYKKSLAIMKNEGMSKMSALYMSSNNILLDYLNYFLNRLIPAGIPQFLAKYGFWFLYRPADFEILDPRRILSMNDLEFGFVLWLIACFLSFYVFVCELYSLYVRRQFRILLGLYEFLRVIRERLRDYHDRW